mmetsp:Transcript_10182/g.18710  ORF Transcript_10182/g.18710 Transcript_10182/m.18710 type:complete len:283 (-) Transcript_10182:1881-2729(-)
MGNSRSQQAQSTTSWADVAARAQLQQQARGGGYVNGRLTRTTAGPKIPPALRKAGNIRNPFSVVKDSVEVEVNEEGLASVKMKIDAELPGDVRVLAVATTLETPQNGSNVTSDVTFTGTVEAGRSSPFSTEPFIDLASIPPKELLYHRGSKTVPLVIEVIRTSEGDEDKTYADRHIVKLSITLEDGSYRANEFQRAISYNGNIYVIKQMYGSMGGDESQLAGQSDGLDDGTDCVVCLSEPRNTTVLPCMHMCLCSSCAQQLMKADTKCPMCRSQVSELWQLK